MSNKLFFAAVAEGTRTDVSAMNDWLIQLIVVCCDWPIKEIVFGFDS